MLSDAWLCAKIDGKKFLGIVSLKYPADSLRRFLFLEFFSFNNASWLSTYFFVQLHSEKILELRFIVQVHWDQEYSKLLKIVII